MDLNLDDLVVLVTGSSKGIGRGIAGAFLREGSRVVLTGRDPGALKDAKTYFGQAHDEDRVSSFRGDLGEPSVVEELARFVEGRFGRLDHLVCNIGTGRSVPPLEEDEPEWERMLDINLMSAATCVRGALFLLEKSARQAQAATSITFVSSICGYEALGCPVAYAAAKSALNSYAKNIARHLGARGIRVNTVSPGNILFPGSTWEDKLAQNKRAVEEMLQREVPLKRLGTLNEVADVVVFLASRRASFITGANVIVDGGQTRSL